MTHWVNTMIDAPLSSELVGQTINFHGPQLQKIWEGERGEVDLQNMAIKSDFNSFQQRQKTLNFQDRGKRLKVQQFIVRNANSLFDLSFTEGHSEARKLPGEEDCYAALPPFETFLSLDRTSRVRHFFQNCKLGNIVIGTILSKTANGLMVKVLSIEDGDRIRFVGDLQIKAFCPVINLIPAVDKKKVSRTYLLNDAVCCEVIEVVPEADKLVLGMKGTMLPPGSDQHSRLGLIFSEDFPDVFSKYENLNTNIFLPYWCSVNNIISVRDR
ncbi:Tetratricopeptide repeat protein 14-like protein [Frankliniella fusca]|uniref:Tetratricopeptide repeat protein 14-like protein n=1 Tax=Frankliniella fusca TaxID=407009 RepID=A0AAE1H4L1_9NEOP|nr:Tetratricopeptide repeat protein 14-like protein [Frankliniella fusca]